jgi:hypothetical protein
VGPGCLRLPARDRGSACDTVALISFSEREFQEINSPGFTATAGACATGIEDGRATLRFVLQSDDGTPIRPGETLGTTTVNLAADSLAFRDTAIFEVPIVEDDPDTTMAPRAEKQCDSGECRQSGMECSTAPGIPDSATARRCQRTAQISLEGPIQFESDTTKPQLFGVLYENSGSLEGSCRRMSATFIPTGMVTAPRKAASTWVRSGLAPPTSRVRDARHSP